MLGKLKIIFSDIKIQHTVFALPFAVMSAFLAAGGSAGMGNAGVDRGGDVWCAQRGDGVQSNRRRQTRRPESAHPKPCPAGRGGDGCSVCRFPGALVGAVGLGQLRVKSAGVLPCHRWPWRSCFSIRSRNASRTGRMCIWDSPWPARRSGRGWR